jgi:hypothetical protein
MNVVYHIVGWDELYENNRTRELKHLQWVLVPNRHDGDGYTLLVDRPNGAAFLGAWLAILQVASKCDPRGTLLREGAVPHDAGSIARITRLPRELLAEAIEVLVNECKWLGCRELKNPAPTCGNPAPTCGKVPLRKELRRMEWNGMEHTDKEASGDKVPTKNSKLSKRQKELTERLEAMLGDQWVNDAGKWVNRTKQQADDVERVVAEVELAWRERRIRTTPAQYAENIWAEFTGQYKTKGRK